MNTSSISKGYSFKNYESNDIQVPENTGNITISSIGRTLKKKTVNLLTVYLTREQWLSFRQPQSRIFRLKLS